VVNSDTGEVGLYCHSSQREKTEQSIEDLYAKRFERELEKLAGGLYKKGTVKRYTKVLERAGRLKQRYSCASRCYELSVEHDMTSSNATALHGTRNKTQNDALPGVYCLRTNQNRAHSQILGR
jgi:hypothetical protein